MRRISVRSTPSAFRDRASSPVVAATWVLELGGSSSRLWVPSGASHTRNPGGMEQTLPYEITNMSLGLSLAQSILTIVSSIYYTLKISKMYRKTSVSDEFFCSLYELEMQVRKYINL